MPERERVAVEKQGWDENRGGEAWHEDEYNCCNGLAEFAEFAEFKMFYVCQSLFVLLEHLYDSGSDRGAEGGYHRIQGEEQKA